MSKTYIKAQKQGGNEILIDVDELTVGNSKALDDYPSQYYRTAGIIAIPTFYYPYRVQNNETIHSIDYSLYILDSGDVAKTLTLPTFAELDTYNYLIYLFNPTKCNFTIDGNSNDIYLNNTTPVSSFVLTHAQSCVLIWRNGGGTYAGWYKI